MMWRLINDEESVESVSGSYVLVAAHGSATAQIREVGERIIDHII